MKKQLLAFTLTAAVLKSIFIPQVASAQSSRLWATYYAGTISGEASSVATDAAGNVYLAGTANSPGLASGGFQDTLLSVGGGNAFLVKFNANGKRLWATYYGGTIGTWATSVATDAAGNVYLSGTTQDTVGIASPGGFLNTFQGNKVGNQNPPAFDAFLVKFDANGNRLWATYYGGTNGTYGDRVATDTAGNVIMSGTTEDTIGIASPGGFRNTFQYPKVRGIFPSFNDFLVKFDANGNRLWATYYTLIGNNSLGTAIANAIATDIAGNVYLASSTNSDTGIASGGFQNNIGGQWDAFLVKFDANGNRLWATYYAGALSLNNGYPTLGLSVATDAFGNVYMCGGTSSPDSIAWKGFRDSLVGGQNQFLTAEFLVKFNAGGNRLWATYYGGEDDSKNSVVTTDVDGNVYLAGVTSDTSGVASQGFENKGVYESIYLVKFDANGNRLCATYYHSADSIQFYKYAGEIGLATDTAENVYLCAWVISPDTVDIAADGFQNTTGGGAISPYLVKFASCSSLVNFQASNTTFCTNTCINYTDLSTNATSWQWSFPGGTPGSSTLQNPQGICYDSAGTYNVKLVVTDIGSRDSITFINFIKSFAPPPTPVITLHHDTLYSTTDTSYASYQWYDSTTLIPGATDTFLIITHGGNYNVAVTNKYGCKISVGINLPLNVGFNEYSDNNFISLYPNPASDKLLIRASSSRVIGKATISIINILGQTVLFLPPRLWRGAGGEASLDIKNIPPGIYFLQMKTENRIDTKRFVKE